MLLLINPILTQELQAQCKYQHSCSYCLLPFCFFLYFSVILSYCLYSFDLKTKLFSIKYGITFSSVHMVNFIKLPTKANDSPFHIICRGYMAPEYIIRGKLTEKADVYAFGVLSLEVACGRRNNTFSHDSASVLQNVRYHILLFCILMCLFHFNALFLHL